MQMSTTNFESISNISTITSNLVCANQQCDNIKALKTISIPKVICTSEIWKITAKMPYVPTAMPAQNTQCHTSQLNYQQRIFGKVTPEGYIMKKCQMHLASHNVLLCICLNNNTLRLWCNGYNLEESGTWAEHAKLGTKYFKCTWKYFTSNAKRLKMSLPTGHNVPDV